MQKCLHVGKGHPGMRLLATVCGSGPGLGRVVRPPRAHRLGKGRGQCGPGLPPGALSLPASVSPCKSLRTCSSWLLAGLEDGVRVLGMGRRLVSGNCLRRWLRFRA